MKLLKELLAAILQIIAVVLVVLVAEFYLLHRYTGDARDVIRLFRVLKIIENNYDGDIDKEKLFEGAMKGMTSAVGDPYTVFLDKKSLKALTERTRGAFGGIGIVFGKKDNNYIVISALDDGPGYKAGVQNGDIIVGVDGKSTSNMNMEEVASKIRGDIGTEVTLELKFKDEPVRKVHIIRKEIKQPSVSGKMLDGTSIGYIRIGVFTESTGEDFRKIYQDLECKGMKATLLDLRRNPGGIFSASVDVAGMLVPKGPIVSVTNKDGATFTETSNLEKVKYPLAVLVDGGSASASEIVSGAIKDTKSGKLFGVKTFGKGSVQNIIQVGNEYGVKVTNAKYYTPSGICVHNNGIEPDVVVELPDKPTYDNQLDAAKKYLLEELNK